MILENSYLHFFDALYFLKILVSESENLWTQLTFVKTGTGNIISKITVHTSTKLAFLEQKREITFAIVLRL